MNLLLDGRLLRVVSDAIKLARKKSRQIFKSRTGQIGEANTSRHGEVGHEGHGEEKI
jgi:hypothetical protein